MFYLIFLLFVSFLLTSTLRQVPQENERHYTAPLKTNMEPENEPPKKEIPIGNHHFQVPCYFAGGEGVVPLLLPTGPRASRPGSHWGQRAAFGVFWPCFAVGDTAALTTCCPIWKPFTIWKSVNASFSCRWREVWWSWHPKQPKWYLCPVDEFMTEQ